MDARLLILGVLHRGDFHPYEIKRRLEAAMVECYVDVDVGTLYYAVRKLEKDGLIAAVAQERVARGGMRTIYRITPEGRAEFRDGLHRQFDVEGPVSQTLYGALLFLHLADRARRRRPRSAGASRGSTSSSPSSARSASNSRRSFQPAASICSAIIEQQRRLDRAWLKDLLADIEAHGIRDVADPAALGKPA